MDSKSPPPIFSEDMSQSACVIEMKKLSEKLRRAYQRRDHYAQMYYKVLAELEDTKWELDMANKKIQELKSQNSDVQISENRTVDTNSAGDSNIITDKESSKDNELSVTPVSTDSNSPKQCESPQHVTTNITAGQLKTNSPKVKRVAFSDDPIPKPMIIQRSFSVSDGERPNGMYSPPPTNSVIQRTQSFSRGKPIQPVTAYMRGPHVPHPPHVNYDHRLPRVHRNLAYETAVPPPAVLYTQQVHTSPHHSPPPLHHPPNSAFRLVQPHLPIHPADYRNQPRYSSLPLRNQRSLLQGLEGGRWRLKNLNRAGLMSLFSDMSLPEVDIRKLEISSSGLGDVEMMSLLCRELKKKHTIEELSLPNNDINEDSLRILLDTVSVCKNIIHLKLINNDITRISLQTIQTFLEKTSLRSLILTGNEIEHHTHLLENPLPQDSTDEYRKANNVMANVTIPTDQQTVAHGIYSNQPIVSSHRNAKMSASSSLPHNMKLLQI